MQDRAQDAPPTTFSIDAVNQPGRGNDTTNTTAQRLLDDVHKELHNQVRADRYKGIAGHMVDLVYDPVTTDHVRLTGIAKRLDAAAANKDYGIIAAQAKIINDELARDRVHDSRKNTVDDIAHDVATVIPSVFKGALRAGEQAIEHKICDTVQQVQAATTKAPDLVTPSTPITHGGDYREVMKVDGNDRAFNMHVPASYQKGHQMPAVVMLHGITENADSFAADTQMNAKADKEGFIAIYPEGNPLLKSQSHLAWNVPNWDIFHPSRHANDVQFVGKVIDQATKELSIDPNRTYVAGFSNGGMLAQEVAAQNSDKVAAVAIVSAALSGKDKEPTNPVSVIDIHGTADTVVPYQNWDNSFRLVDMQPVAYTGTFWKKADNIEGPSITSERNGITVQDAINSKTGVEVKQIGIEGGTHTWPGAAHNDGAADKSLEATDEIWDFFSHHTLAKGDANSIGNQRTTNA
ncbi:MAG: alpha/beta fold hydrolase [Cyanobacteria bacterium REEB67]|nr:alpha/beta fold hydrolase [Cyanobacteria bacterium REEB67]